MGYFNSDGHVPIPARVEALRRIDILKATERIALTATTSQTNEPRFGRRDRPAWKELLPVIVLIAAAGLIVGASSGGWLHAVILAGIVLAEGIAIVSSVRRSSNSSHA